MAEPQGDESDIVVLEEEEDKKAREEALDVMRTYTNATKSAEKNVADESNDPPGAEQEEAEDKPEPSSEAPMSKEEKKRLKKERKRLKKEKKKAKKRNKDKKIAETSEESTAESDAEQVNAKFSEEEDEKEAGLLEEEEGKVSGKPEQQQAQFSDEDENINGQFSGDDGNFSDDGEKGNAQFSDTEMMDTDEKDQVNKDGKGEDNEKVDPFAAIPRKRKSPPQPNKPSSLIANVEASSSTDQSKGPSAALMTSAEDEEDFRNSDDEQYDDPTDAPNVSVSALKNKIIGRQIKTAQDVEEEEDAKLPAHPYTTDAKISHQLRKELACAICHECYLHPVSLLCGHSFCKECIQWWWQTSTTNDTKNCPTCRQEIPIANVKSLGVNLALRACVLALLSNEVQARLDAQRLSRKGENEGAHDKGYEVLVDATADSWKQPGIPWKCRRSSVLDAEDQRMQLALGIWKDSNDSINGMNYNPRTQTLNVSLCILQMEEDEVADGGFPRVVHADDDDEENDQLLVSRSGGRFVHSFVQATACFQQGKATNNKKLPLGRRGIQATGIVEMSLELTSPELAGADYISFEHEETGAVLDLKLPDDMMSNGEGEGRPAPPKRQKSGRTAITAVDVDDDVEEEQEHQQRPHHHDSEEEDGSHLDQFEDDAFIAEEGEEEEEMHEDDFCAICKEPGDLIVCDGGDGLGCARSFHLECINRTEVPRGDWICQDCAKKDIDLVVGIEGHEITTSTEKEEGDGTAIEINDSELESPPPRKKRKREINSRDVIDLEDEDESDAAGFDSPAKGGGHIGGDSDDEDGEDNGDEDEEEEMRVQPRAKKPRPKKRIFHLDDDDDDDD